MTEKVIAPSHHILVSPEDEDLLKHPWRLTHGYAVRGSKKRETLHRLVLERALGRQLQKEELVDHVNGDKLDNRRENLRPASHTDNMRNRKTHRNNRSGHQGVYWYPNYEKWRAQIHLPGGNKTLGYFASLEDAIAARQSAAERYHGEFAAHLSRH